MSHQANEDVSNERDGDFDDAEHYESESSELFDSNFETENNTTTHEGVTESSPIHSRKNAIEEDIGRYAGDIADALKGMDLESLFDNTTKGGENINEYITTSSKKPAKRRTATTRKKEVSPITEKPKKAPAKKGTSPVIEKPKKSSAKKDTSPIMETPTKSSTKKDVSPIIEKPKRKYAKKDTAKVPKVTASAKKETSPVIEKKKRTKKPKEQ